MHPSLRTPLLSARALVHDYITWAGDRGVVRALDGVCLDVYRGETLGLIGASGSGKSTLARVLLQCPRPKSGSVRLLGHELTRLRGGELRARRRPVQVVFQEPRESLDPTWRVSAIVEEPLRHDAGLTRDERHHRVDALLERVGMRASTFGRRRPAELSGGQCQRIAIARALASSPALLICDEAVASLDASMQAEILRLLDELRADLGVAYLFISHDLRLVQRISERIAVLLAGRLCEIGPAECVGTQPLHPYTAEMRVCALNVVAPLEEEPAQVTRNGANTDTGCAFRWGCSRAGERCFREAPELRPVKTEHFVACHFPLMDADRGVTSQR
jgi:oligopeptide transport system ATP-binding protein